MMSLNCHGKTRPLWWLERSRDSLIFFELFTQITALEMIRFIAVQSLTDLYGLGWINEPATLAHGLADYQSA